jgi:hypothetical protein
MISAKVTEYIRPNGETQERTVELADECLENLEKIEALGLKFTAELITPVEAALCIQHDEHGDYDILLAENFRGKDSPTEALQRLILRFDEAEYQRWLDSHREAEEVGL